MTQLGGPHPTSKPPTAAERIRGAVEQGHLETAKKLLLDYARDVADRDLLDSATLLASELAQCVRANLIDGEDNTRDRIRITKAMLVLASDLAEQERKPSVSVMGEPRGPWKSQ
jgi:hypothetical protein